MKSEPRKFYRGWVMGTVLLLGLHSGILAQTVSTAASQLDPIDNLGGTARAIAMGSAFTGVAGDASAVLWNPAGLANLEGTDLSLNHSSWLAQTFQEELLLGVALPGGGLGLSTHYVGYGSFDGRDVNGFPVSSYSADQVGLGLGWGERIIGGLSAGVVLHGSQMTLAGISSTLLAGDIGLMYKTQDGWGIGASYENLGLGSASQSLASSLRLGVSRAWKDWGSASLLTAVGADIEPNGNDSVQVGAEFGYQSTLFIRAGYDLQFQNTGFTGTQGLTAGAGIQIASIKLDYAFVPYGELGSVNLVSLGYSFGAQPAATQSTKVISPSVAPKAVVAPQPIPDTGSKTPERTITMEFEVPSNGDMEQAKALAQAGKNAEAILAFKAILGKDTNNVSAWRELGNLYFKVGRKDDAIQCFETVLKLKPGDQVLSDWLERYRDNK